MKNTKTVKTTSRFKRTVAASLAAVMMMTTAATISASADTQAAVSMNTNSAQTRIVREQYLGHDITPGSFTREGTTINFKYSDGFFETDPKMYNPHMATTSAAMTKASVNYATSKGNYTNAADCIKSVLKQEGFESELCRLKLRRYGISSGAVIQMCDISWDVFWTVVTPVRNDGCFSLIHKSF